MVASTHKEMEWSISKYYFTKRMRRLGAEVGLPLGFVLYGLVNSDLLIRSHGRPDEWFAVYILATCAVCYLGMWAALAIVGNRQLSMEQYRFIRDYRWNEAGQASLRTHLLELGPKVPLRARHLWKISQDHVYHEQLLKRNASAALSRAEAERQVQAQTQAQEALYQHYCKEK